MIIDIWEKFHQNVFMLEMCFNVSFAIFAQVGMSGEMDLDIVVFHIAVIVA